MTTHPAAATEASVLADITGMLTRLLEDEYGLDDVEIGMTTTFNRDLELESIDLVALIVEEEAIVILGVDQLRQPVLQRAAQTLAGHRDVEHRRHAAPVRVERPGDRGHRGRQELERHQYTDASERLEVLARKMPAEATGELA